MVVVVVVVVIVVVIVAVTATGELEAEEQQPGRDEQRPDDRVLSVLDRGAQLETDDDDHRTEHHRHEHVRHAGQSGQPSDLLKRIPAGAADHRERNPVVREDCVAEADAGGRNQECWGSYSPGRRLLDVSRSSAV